jgi:hypothetical protein
MMVPQRKARRRADTAIEAAQGRSFTTRSERMAGKS